MEKWFRERILPFIVISILGAFAKMSYDVYAFTSVKGALNGKIEKNSENLDELEDRLNTLHNKIDNILTGLCMIDEKTCRLKQ